MPAKRDELASRDGLANMRDIERTGQAVRQVDGMSNHGITDQQANPARPSVPIVAIAANRTRQYQRERAGQQEETAGGRGGRGVIVCVPLRPVPCAARDENRDDAVRQAPQCATHTCSNERHRRTHHGEAADKQPEKGRSVSSAVTQTANNLAR